MKAVFGGRAAFSYDSSMRSAMAIFHVPFEDLGTLEPELRSAGFEIHPLDASTSDLKNADVLAPDLLIVMGGPVGVYETEAYPFLEDEVALIRERLTAQKPTLGICLGAQLMAAAVGARVYPGTQGKEIGWGTLQKGRDAERCPSLSSLFDEGVRVLHWHGDTFDLPACALHLARTSQYENQAFALGNYALALQFHPEVTAPALERWYVGHCAELSGAKISIPQLRRDSLRYAPHLQASAKVMWKEWLKFLSFI